MSFFSIVTPSLNQGRFIEDAILSVLGQAPARFEHIVVDGGSSDGTLDILKKYPHLIWVSETDAGKTPAVNRGFRMAKGDVLAWLGTDDRYAEGAFREAERLFTDPAVKAVIGRARVIDENGAFLFDHADPAPAGFTHEGIIRFWKYGTLPQPSLFFRREVLDEIGGLDENIWSYMDYDWMLRLSRRFRLVRSPEVLSHIRAHGEADTVLNVASGALYEALYRISRRYWSGGPLERWARASSYWLHRPGIARRVRHESLAYAFKHGNGRSRRRALLRYPDAALPAAAKRVYDFLTGSKRS